MRHQPLRLLESHPGAGVRLTKVRSRSKGKGRSRSKIKVKVKGSGQECPLYFFSDQLQLLGLGGSDAHAFYSTIGGVEDFELQAFVFDDFAFLRDASG